VGSTIAYFQEIRTKDSYFYWRIKLDDEDRVENLFWIDGASRRAYAKYNDCLSFDTTYMTNMYNMSCAPFIGINNHGQSIQFGCGFIRNELKENFVWLFNTFLHAMGGVAPKNIITDQDFAMRSVIDEVFLNIIHRNCRRHIMKKAQE
uniref:MULE transposase domain-containing protein n=2 Tax=Aegilops tauschii subsp. strangulata TaxID=200361 RepID=A0A452Z5Q3_AEGTS